LLDFLYELYYDARIHEHQTAEYSELSAVQPITVHV